MEFERDFHKKRIQLKIDNKFIQKKEWDKLRHTPFFEQINFQSI